MALLDIETIVVVILENRSFDHMLGYLSTSATNAPLPVEGIRDDPAWQAQYANTYGTRQFPLHVLDPTVQTIEDPPHEQSTIATQINTPSVNAMKGFVESYMQRNPQPQDASPVMGYYTNNAVPIFDFFARNFTVCDHWFSALPTGTQANRLMAMSGESSIVNNAPVFLPDQRLVYDWLTDHQVSWCAYQSGDFLPFFSLMSRLLPEITTSLTLSDLGGRGRFRRYARFREEWLGTDPCPNVIFIEPQYTDGPHQDPNDDHPPTGVAKGQAFIADIYNTLIANPARWRNTVLLVTYDEHGGFFDHVAPLPIPTNVGGFSFTTTGVRVPAFIISPQVAPGVFNGNLDHTSILQLLADRFNPNQDYSAAVGARQPHLVRLSALIANQQLAINAPPIPNAALAALRAAPTFQIAPASAAILAPGAVANAQALENAAVKAMQDHPDLLKLPGWQPLTNFVGVTSLTV